MITTFLSAVVIAQSLQPDTPVLLRVDTSQRGSNVYHMNMNLEMDLKATGSEAGKLPENMETKMDTDILAKFAPDGKGGLKLSSQLIGYPKVMANGMEVPLPGETMKAIQMTMDRLGRVKYAKMPTAGSGLGLGSLNNLGSSFALALPEKPVRYGDSWSFAGDASGLMAGKITATYLGQEMVKGRNCNVLAINMDIDMGEMMGSLMGMFGGEKGNSKFAFSVTGRNYLNAKTGLTESSEMNMYGAMRLSMNDKEGKPQEISMKMKMSMAMYRVK